MLSTHKKPLNLKELILNDPEMKIRVAIRKARAEFEVDPFSFKNKDNKHA